VVNTGSFVWNIPSYFVPTNGYLLSVYSLNVDAEIDPRQTARPLDGSGNLANQVVVSILVTKEIPYRLRVNKTEDVDIVLYGQFGDAPVHLTNVADATTFEQLTTDVGVVHTVQVLGQHSVGSVTIYKDGIVEMFGIVGNRDDNPNCLTFTSCDSCSTTLACGWCDTQSICIPLAEADTCLTFLGTQCTPSGGGIPTWAWVLLALFVFFFLLCLLAAIHAYFLIIENRELRKYRTALQTEIIDKDHLKKIAKQYDLDTGDGGAAGGLGFFFGRFL